MSLSQSLSIVKSGGENLTENQIKNLSNLKRSDGSKLLPPDDTQLIFEIAFAIEEKGYEIIYQFLLAHQVDNREYLLLENPSMENAKLNAMIDLDIFKRKTTVETSITCPRCKSPNQMVIQVQVRSADEPMDTFIYCSRCGRMPYHQSI